MRTLLAALALVVLAGCGGDDKTDFEKAVDDSPKCSDLWVEGSEIPDGYEGCKDEAGDLAVAFSYDCDDGSTMYVHGDETRFWTVAGKVAAGSEEDYSAAFDNCKPS